jgi:hypothetical protein
MSDNRIAQISGPVVSSPTGAPVMPQNWVRYAFGVAAVLLAVSQFTPDHTIAHSVAERGLDLLTLIGLISPGWRSK